jgi:ABC-2 type transport system ATP-binding protein
VASVLAIHDLAKDFDLVAAVAGVSLDVQPKEIVGLVGPDGAGKTTLLRMVAGLMAPTRGRVEVLGVELEGALRELRAQVGYMPQQYSLYLDLSVEENLRFFAGMYGVPRALMLERERRLLGIARLEEFRDRPVGALSGGMYKKLALSIALVHAPRLLLLDEPTNGVDPISRRELWAFLRELIADGVGVLVSTPYMDEAERCDRVGLMVGGRLVALAPPDELKQRFASTVLELSVEPPLRDPALLAAVSGVEQVYAVGRKLHVVSTAGASLATALAAVIEAAGTQLQSSRVVPPTFEDIFLSLTHRAETEAPHAAR